MLLHKVYVNYSSNFSFFMHKFPSYLCRVDLTEQAVGKGQITLSWAKAKQAHLWMLKWHILGNMCSSSPLHCRTLSTCIFGSYAEVLKKKPLWAGDDLGVEASKTIICFGHFYYMKNWKYPNLLWSLNSIYKMKSY